MNVLQVNYDNLIFFLTDAYAARMHASQIALSKVRRWSAK